MRNWALAAAAALIGVCASWTTVPDAATSVRIPLNCSRGPSGQHCDLIVTVPQSAAEGSTISVRVDGTDSGKVSHTGLNYIHDMTTELLVPSGTMYVTGSGKIIPGTGTENVRPGATVAHRGAAIVMTLPAHVEDGASYTPPSFEYQLKVTASAGATIVHKFSQYRVTANAFIIGDVHTTCDPTPKPYAVGRTSVTAADPPAQP
jgi:hypothetical protein